MAQQKKGFIARMLEGKERSEEYARSTLPTNRWQLFWDIFKGNFGKIVKVNLLTLLFFLPTIAVIILRGLMEQSNGIIFPYGANVGVSPFPQPNLAGMDESLTLQLDLYTFAALTFCSFISAIGLAGGMYVVRNMVWTEGIFVSNDFWRGVKTNYKNALQTTLFFCVTVFFCLLLINMSNHTLAVQELSKARRVWLEISRGVSIGFIVLVTMMSFWQVALGVNYRQNFFHLFKNSFLMTIGTLPQTVFFGAIAVVPFALFFLGEGMFMFVAIILLLLCGIAYALLVWIDFAQWAFDKYINPNVQGAKVGRGIYNKDGTSAQTGGDQDSAAAREYNRTIVAAGKSQLVARPIKPIDDSLQVYELPTAFTREDLKRLRDSKQNIVEDTEAYAEEHQHDLRYVEYNRQFEERERALQEEIDAKKKKKHKSKKDGQ